MHSRPLCCLKANPHSLHKVDALEVHHQVDCPATTAIRSAPINEFVKPFLAGQQQPKVALGTIYVETPTAK
jgi:hypothetical protein